MLNAYAIAKVGQI